MQTDRAEVAVIGAGIIGIATAYALTVLHGQRNVVLIDAGQPMVFTSAQSGENYRNWWPHPIMVDFTNRSIDLLEGIARETGNRIAMTRRGYALATRETKIDPILEQLAFGLGDQAETLVRVHEPGAGTHYLPPLSASWEEAPDGVDVLRDPAQIRATFPSFDPEIRTVIHVRRGGDISGQQLGTVMLERFRAAGGRRLTGQLDAIERNPDYQLTIRAPDGVSRIDSVRIVNAAGPFAGAIAGMLGVELPVHNVLQQKIAFEDTARAIPRGMPFAIDLDPQVIDWTDDERKMLLEDPELAWLTEAMPGSIHCRPDGGDAGSWVKLGWAFNDIPGEASWNAPLTDSFPEIVLRGAARLNPALRQYYGRLPAGRHHYGGWYTMTPENWPLIGPMGPEGAFMNCAHSGFGTMAACAAGELCAAWVVDGRLPGYARAFSMDRYDDTALMALLEQSNKGLL